jgi:hypothetical protein
VPCSVEDYRRQLRFERDTTIWKIWTKVRCFERMPFAVKYSIYQASWLTNKGVLQKYYENIGRSAGAPPPPPPHYHSQSHHGMIYCLFIVRKLPKGYSFRSFSDERRHQNTIILYFYSPEPIHFPTSRGLKGLLMVKDGFYIVYIILFWLL